MPFPCHACVGVSSLILSPVTSEVRGDSRLHTCAIDEACQSGSLQRICNQTYPREIRMRVAENATLVELNGPNLSARRAMNL
ncbi:hypothetical protein BJV74DRAFT_867250 [Russula compacta]|nr:hypothetical protein BJV74DRAFT_867250 [Russula compacta]